MITLILTNSAKNLSVNKYQLMFWVEFDSQGSSQYDFMKEGFELLLLVKYSIEAVGCCIFQRTSSENKV
jgi:hypothetical protein